MGVKEGRSTAIWLALVVALGLAARAIAADSSLERPVLDVDTAIGPVTYTPGRGLHVGDTGLVLGGYTDFAVVRPDGGPVRGGLNDLSLFVIWDPLERLHLFSELELEGLHFDDSGKLDASDLEFSAERLYADAIVVDPLTIRVGKFLTPVGRWNVVHAQPLVWTTSRPLATLLPFDPHTTGAMAFGALPAPGGTVGYSVFGQATDPLDPVATPQQMHRGGGVRGEYQAWGGWAVGATYLGYSAGPDHTAVRWRQLVGVDAVWRSGPVELLGEFAHVQDQWGLYAQAAVEVISPVFAIARYEYYDPSGQQHPLHLGIGGLAWKPWSWLVGKVEYRFASDRQPLAPPGFAASIAVLF